MAGVYLVVAVTDVNTLPTITVSDAVVVYSAIDALCASISVALRFDPTVFDCKPLPINQLRRRAVALAAVVLVLVTVSVAKPCSSPCAQ